MANVSASTPNDPSSVNETPRPPHAPRPSNRLGRVLAGTLIIALSLVVWQLLAAESTATSDTDNGHGDGPTNRLATSSSPYLLLHKNNPVDWYPWGEEALSRAKAENKPIFLSVGYSTCYWCHVMERQSFSDPEIAALMNEHFVNIKVDREERPDLDEIYMTATQLLTRSGGWPNSVFLTPDLQPFFAGTYFPPDDVPGRPGFRRVLTSMHEAWTERRDQVQEQAKTLTDALRRNLVEQQAPAEQAPGAELVDAAVESLTSRFDAEWGGFGGAPKFPSPANLLLLLELLPQRPELEPMVATTLDQMARGGIYDQLGGGFHRYATDEKWRIPHFEKMLYDNGLLLEVYAHWYALSDDEQAARVMRETAAFLAREMTDPQGGLWSAIDAETNAQEGEFYVWTRGEIDAALGKEKARFAAPLLGYAGDPFFEEDHFVLHLPQSFSDAAASRDTTRAELTRDLAPARQALLASRDQRERPLTDDKVLADWNGMTIAGLARAGHVLGDKNLVNQAVRAAEFVLANLRTNGKLKHAWRGGVAHIPAYLDDYAYMIHGLLTLDEVTESPRWRTAAIELSREMTEQLGAETGGFYAATDQPDLLVRTRPVADGATPGGNAIAALNLLTLGKRTGAAKWHDQAEASLRAFAPLAERAPGATRTLAIAAHRFGGKRVAAAGGLDDLTAEARSVVTASASVDDPEGDGWYPVVIQLEIQESWHVNANPASDAFLVPTAVAESAGSLRDLRYPHPKMARFPFADEPIAVWEKRALITGSILPPNSGQATVTLTYQACDDERCLPPVRLEVPVE